MTELERSGRGATTEQPWQRTETGHVPPVVLSPRPATHTGWSPTAWRPRTPPTPGGEETP